MAFARLRLLARYGHLLRGNEHEATLNVITMDVSAVYRWSGLPGLKLEYNVLQTLCLHPLGIQSITHFVPCVDTMQSGHQIRVCDTVVNREDTTRSSVKPRAILVCISITT